MLYRHLEDSMPVAGLGDSMPIDEVLYRHLKMKVVCVSLFSFSFFFFFNNCQLGECLINPTDLGETYHSFRCKHVTFLLSQLVGPTSNKSGLEFFNICGRLCPYKMALLKFSLMVFVEFHIISCKQYFFPPMTYHSWWDPPVIRRLGILQHLRPTLHWASFAPVKWHY